MSTPIEGAAVATAALTIPDLIAAHCVAIRMDEAAYNDDFEHISGTADESEALEKAIMRALIAAPCTSLDDVSAKAGYLVHGTVGQREPLLFDVLGVDGSDTLDEAGPFLAFMRSLILPAPEESVA